MSFWVGDVGERYPFGLLLALGYIPNMQFVEKFGRNAVIDTATVPEDIWGAGGLYPLQTTAQAMEILGGADDDTTPTAGTGAHTVEVQYVDGNFKQQIETITMNGVTAVALSGTALMVYRMKVLTSGSTGANVGTIICRIASAGATLAQITATFGQTLMAVWVVPAGYTAYLTGLYSTMIKPAAAAANAQLSLNTFDATKNRQIKHLWGMYSDGVSSYIHDWQTPLAIPEKHFITIRCEAVSANNTNVAAGFSAQLVQNAN